MAMPHEFLNCPHAYALFIQACCKSSSSRNAIFLRHTVRIILSEGQVNIFNLAKNAGTSVDQIERFYARNLPLIEGNGDQSAEFWKWVSGSVCVLQCGDSVAIGGIAEVARARSNRRD